jgi:hypothetical protein
LKTGKNKTQFILPATIRFTAIIPCLVTYASFSHAIVEFFLQHQGFVVGLNRLDRIN